MDRRFQQQVALSTLIAGVLCNTGGCTVSGTPPPAPSRGAMQSTPDPPTTASQPTHTTATTDLDRLTFQTQNAFEVEVPHQSPAVEKHYDALAEKQGWIKKLAVRATDPGGRKWISTGARVGPTDAYDAAWEDPKSGQVAILNLWHVAGEKDRQHGSFELYPKDQSPFTTP